MKTNKNKRRHNKNDAQNVENATCWARMNSDSVVVSFGKPECNSDTTFGYMISRDEIQTCDTKRFLSVFHPDSKNPIIQFGMGKVLFFMDGYDSDPRELWEIPECRAFIAKIHKEFPCWIFFVDLESDWLSVVIACLLKVEHGHVCVSAHESFSFFREQLDLLLSLGLLANKSVDEMTARLNEVLSRFSSLMNR